MTFWTPEREEELLTLWAKGISASRIAAKMGNSRNAVIGKITRLRGRFADSAASRIPQTGQMANKGADALSDDKLLELLALVEGMGLQPRQAARRIGITTIIAEKAIRDIREGLEAMDEPRFAKMTPTDDFNAKHGVLR